MVRCHLRDVFLGNNPAPFLREISNASLDL